MERYMSTFKVARSWFAVGAISAALIVALSVSASTRQPEDKAAAAAQDSRYIRTVEKDHGQELVMQSAARTFVPADGKAGPSVTMCAAVHIADRSFYEKLQALLDAKDVVLFESVKPSGTGR